MAQPHFNRAQINEAIAANGFAVVPFCTAEQVEELRAFYAQLPPQQMPGTHVTMFNPSYQYRKAVDEKLRSTCSNTVNELMNGYRVLYGNYMVKETGAAGDFPVHQDWTYVDEQKFASYAFWVPLQNVDETNGALQVVRGSHKIITALRGPYVHEPFKDISEPIKEKYAEPVRLKAGEALVWDHRLVHFSLPNVTATPRLAFTVIAVPEGAPVIHCFGLNETHGTLIEQYEVDTDFFLNYTIGSKPAGVPLLQMVTQPAVDFKEEELNKLFAPVLNLPEEEVIL